LMDIVVNKVPNPFPYYYARGLGFNVYMSQGDEPSMVINKQPVVKPYFFLYGFLIKTPIPMLLFLLLAVLLCFKYRKFDEFFVIVPVLVLHAAFLNTTKQFGYRYVLSTIPLLIVLISRIMKFNFKKFHKVLLGLLCLWYVISSVMAYPHYHSYVNEFVGFDNAYLHVVDSTIDWGQDLFFLADYLQDNEFNDAKISYYGFPAIHGHRIPDYYGFDHEVMGCGPVNGTIVISVTHLMKKQDCYGWLLEYEPVDRIGNTMFVYIVE